MKTFYSSRFTTGVIGYPMLFFILIWLIFWAEIRFGLNLKTFGIYPRKIQGLIGIFSSVFIHSSLSHLYQNSIPLFVLSVALFYFYKPLSWKIIFLGIVFSGILTWCIGEKGYHIGASGLIYVLMSFLLFKGLLSKHKRLIALSLVVVFIYGGMIWYIFPVKEKMSWEGHLSGFIVGLLFALLFKSHKLNSESFDWESENYDQSQDHFLQQFDKDGNFIDQHDLNNSIDNTTINYDYKSEN